MLNLDKPKKKQSYTLQKRLLSEVPVIAKELNIEDLSIDIIDIHILPHANYCGLNNHSHSFFEIHIPISGKGRIQIGQKTKIFNPGKFTITCPGETHNWRALGSSITVQIWWVNILKLNDANSSEINALLIDLISKNNGVYNLPDEYMVYYNLMINELKEKKVSYREAVKNCVKMSLINLIRATTSSNKLYSNHSFEPDNESRIEKLINHYIHDNIDKPITIEEIAKQLKMSPRTAMRQYKKSTGITIGQKIISARIQNSAKLLRESDMQIKSVAYKSGFTDISYFSKLFKKVHGISPTAYRNKNQPVIIKRE